MHEIGLTVINKKGITNRNTKGCCTVAFRWKGLGSKRQTSHSVIFRFVFQHFTSKQHTTFIARNNLSSYLVIQSVQHEKALHTICNLYTCLFTFKDKYVVHYIEFRFPHPACRIFNCNKDCYVAYYCIHFKLQQNTRDSFRTRVSTVPKSDIVHLHKVLFEINLQLNL